ncbi:MAG: family 10 glycosylhydrolase [Aphanocapsa sp. GSE-SYN-MK-11-07L]|nr:family 10 glycosylhydrolase [Aphanocapsa sp. GSE-SYN-MK-11-07L]
MLGLSTGVMLVAIALHRPPDRKAANTPEIRGVWMTNIALSGLYHTTFLDEVLHDIAAHQINTLYPGVWSQGKTFYPSRVAPQSLSVGDILQATVQTGQRQGLRVIPWFEYGLKVTDDSQIAQQHPDWLTRNAAGSVYINPQPKPQSLPLLSGFSRSLSGANHVVMNPAHPQVQEFMVNLLTDVVERYDIDGIQLDDHFALPIAFGYDPYTKKLFQQENGYPPPTDPNHPEWMRWRADKLTQLMAKISRSIKQKKPDLIISIAPNSPAFAYQESLQDWPTWVRRGYVDEVVVQAYRPTVAEVNTVLADPEIETLRQFVPIRVGLYTGPGWQAQTSAAIAAQIQVGRNKKYNGFVLFPWEFSLGPMRRGDLSSLIKVIQNQP